MKTLLLFLTLSSTFFSKGQDSLSKENAEIRIKTFNDSITKLLNQYEKDDVDFIAIRSSKTYGPNCRFIIRKDSCTQMFILHLGENNLVTHIHSATIASRIPNDTRNYCPKELDNMYAALTYYEDYFTKSQPDNSRYDTSRIIFFGSVDGRYMLEVVNENYFSTHHPRMFYATFRSWF